jgi:uncharacterized membrane protein YhaH (DUF805 family)
MADWVLRPWRESFKFSGRVTRREFWFFQLQLVVAFFGVMFLAGMVAGAAVGPEGDGVALGLVLLGFYIYALVANLAASVRRLHDHDKSGFFYLLSLIPLVGWIFYLIMMLTPGTPGENSYGYDPREGDHVRADEVAGVFT